MGAKFSEIALDCVAVFEVFEVHPPLERANCKSSNCGLIYLTRFQSSNSDLKNKNFW